MKKFEKLMCLGVISSLFITSTCAFANNGDIVRPVVNENMITVDGDYGVVPYSTSYEYSNFPVTQQATFSASITLSNTYKYGKAFYTNNSDSAVTIRVYGNGVDETKTIKGGSSEPIKFTKSGRGDQEYKVDIKGGSKNLNGIFSLAMSDSEFR